MFRPLTLTRLQFSPIPSAAAVSVRKPRAMQREQSRRRHLRRLQLSSKIKRFLIIEASTLCSTAETHLRALHPFGTLSSVNIADALKTPRSVETWLMLERSLNEKNFPQIFLELTPVHPLMFKVHSSISRQLDRFASKPLRQLHVWFPSALVHIYSRPYDGCQ